MNYILAQSLAAAIIGGCITLAFGAFARSWARMLLGAGVIAAALAAGYWWIL